MFHNLYSFVVTDKQCKTCVLYNSDIFFQSLKLFAKPFLLLSWWPQSWKVLECPGIWVLFWNVLESPGISYFRGNVLEMSWILILWQEKIIFAFWENWVVVCTEMLEILQPFGKKRRNEITGFSYHRVELNNLGMCCRYTVSR